VERADWSVGRHSIKVSKYFLLGLEVLVVVMIQAVLLCVMTLCSLACGYHCLEKSAVSMFRVPLLS
jgi:hypothetical protein